MSSEAHTYTFSVPPDPSSKQTNLARKRGEGRESRGGGRTYTLVQSVKELARGLVVADRKEEGGSKDGRDEDRVSLGDRLVEELLLGRRGVFSVGGSTEQEQEGEGGSEGRQAGR